MRNSISIAAILLVWLYIGCATNKASSEPVKEKKTASSETTAAPKKKEAVDYEEEMLKGNAKLEDKNDSYLMDRAGGPSVTAATEPKEEKSSERVSKYKEKETSSKDLIEEEKAESEDREEKISGKTDAKEAESDLHTVYKKVPEKAKQAPTESGLKAGYSDDNKQFNYFIRFLEEKKYADHLPLPVSERIILKVTDKNGKSIPNAAIHILSNQKELERGHTIADGSFLFFPSEFADSYSVFTAKITAGTSTKEISFTRYGARQIPVSLETTRPSFKAVPLDIVFILDTTGSMNDEINRLKETIEIININVSNFNPKPEVRFGMILYRDLRDEYLAKVIPLTGNLEEFNRELAKVEADGGGDTPEDLQTALSESLNKLQWNTNGIRLSFIITDAPPHLDYQQPFSYTSAVKEAKKRAIKYYSIGTGELNLDGEYVLRQISQYTSAKYIFLTYGEKGESEGGAPGSVSHHTGSNYQTDKLEAIVINIAREEMANLSETQPVPPDEYFKADKIVAEKNEETLQKLFDKALTQLEDYSSLAFSSKLPAAVMPFEDKGESSKVSCEYFAEQASFSLSRSRFFKPLERMDLQKVMNELSLNQSKLASEENAAKVGKLLGAKAIIIGNMYKESGYYRIFLKLVDSETGVILSMTKLVVDEKLGVGGK